MLKTFAQVAETADQNSFTPEMRDMTENKQMCNMNLVITCSHHLIINALFKLKKIQSANLT